MPLVAAPSVPIAVKDLQISVECQSLQLLIHSPLLEELDSLMILLRLKQTHLPFRRRKICLPGLSHPVLGNEEQQLAWAKRESEKAEQERLARLRRQEQEDLELAIALSKADMPTS
uniref:Uncharacterized protein n=1 Tax=Micrurus spixii TaxID=129469 RepID=A0A2D4N994_9SAUR